MNAGGPHVDRTKLQTLSGTEEAKQAAADAVREMFEQCRTLWSVASGT